MTALEDLPKTEQQDIVMLAFCHGAYIRFGSITAVSERERGAIAEFGATTIHAAFMRVDYTALRTLAQTLVRMETDPDLAIRDSLKAHVKMMKQMIRDVVGIARTDVVKDAG